MKPFILFLALSTVNAFAQSTTTANSVPAYIDSTPAQTIARDFDGTDARADCNTWLNDLATSFNLSSEGSCSPGSAGMISGKIQIDAIKNRPNLRDFIDGIAKLESTIKANSDACGTCSEIKKKTNSIMAFFKDADPLSSSDCREKSQNLRKEILADIQPLYAVNNLSEKLSPLDERHHYCYELILPASGEGKYAKAYPNHRLPCPDCSVGIYSTENDCEKALRNDFSKATHILRCDQVAEVTAFVCNSPGKP